MSMLNQLKDYRVVKVSLPLKNGKKSVLDGVAKATEQLSFEVTFLPDQLDTAALNDDDFLMVTFDVAGENKSIKAKLVSAEENDKLVLEMVDSVSYIQKRHYFRVDADLSVSYWVIDEDNPTARSVQTSVNISGGGLRLPVSETIRPETKLGLEIVLDSPQPRVIECSGKVVSNYNHGGDRYIALSFVDIDEEDQDAIIAHCLAEQRRQLRLKVQVLGASVVE